MLKEDDMGPTPLELLPPVIMQSLRRYLGYHWGDSLILSLIHRRHGVKLSHTCVDNLRSGRRCTCRWMSGWQSRRKISSG